jgi:hypothetical protein
MAQKYILKKKASQKVEVIEDEDAAFHPRVLGTDHFQVLANRGCLHQNALKYNSHVIARCQIFLATTYQNWKKYTKLAVKITKMYLVCKIEQMAINFTKL